MSKPLQIGDRVPQVTFRLRDASGWVERSSADVFDGRTVIAFALPGAFTPTCDARHLPGFVQHAADFTAKGVDTVACMAVNDVFVMKAWGKASAVEDTVLMLADGNGDYAKALGLELDATGFGMGMRGKRFAIVVQDGVAQSVLVEGPGEFKVSSAEHVLGQL
jgi:peroxiredoxin